MEACLDYEPRLDPGFVTMGPLDANHRGRVTELQFHAQMRVLT